MWTSLKVKNCKEETSLKGIPHSSINFSSRSPTRFQQWKSEKNLQMFGRGESSFFNICPECSIFLNKICPQDLTISMDPNPLRFYQRLTDPRQGEYLSPTLSDLLSHLSGEKTWKALVKVTVQWHKFNKSLRPSHRVIEFFSSPHTLPPHQGITSKRTPHLRPYLWNL